jgi:AmmeMemoRadiSam system protein B
MRAHRKPAVAGLFYSNDPEKLRADVESYVSGSTTRSKRPVKFLISPHAGFVYSGKIAGEAFIEAERQNVRRLFLLGPSHRHYFEGIAEAEESFWDCPLGTATVTHLDDQRVLKNSRFHADEHCLEVQLPFITHLFPDATITPLLLSGALSNARKIANQLLRFDAPDTLWVISSDFSHCGPGFHYHPRSVGFDSGEAMDRHAIRLIVSGEMSGFDQFLRNTKSTICGALPILVSMFMRAELNLPNYAFKKYDCSGNQTGDETSVGYAALYC